MDIAELNRLLLKKMSFFLITFLSYNNVSARYVKKIIFTFIHPCKSSYQLFAILFITIKKSIQYKLIELIFVLFSMIFPMIFPQFVLFYSCKVSGTYDFILT